MPQRTLAVLFPAHNTGGGARSTASSSKAGMGYMHGKSQSSRERRRGESRGCAVIERITLHAAVVKTKELGSGRALLASPYL